MNCTSTQDMFSALADGELNAADVARIEGHLATCRQCRQEWHFFRESLDWLQEIQPVTAPTDLPIGIHAKLERKNRHHMATGSLRLPTPRLVLPGGHRPCPLLLDCQRARHSDASWPHGRRRRLLPDQSTCIPARQNPGPATANNAGHQ